MTLFARSYVSFCESRPGDNTLVGLANYEVVATTESEVHVMDGIRIYRFDKCCFMGVMSSSLLVFADLTVRTEVMPQKALA